MTDLAALGLTVTSDGIVRATGSLNEFKRASDVAAAGANRVEVQAAELSGAMRRLDATANQSAVSMQQLTRSSQGGAGGLQNVGFQVQDFAVQVAAGTSATQALAQQLPQLLSGFGLLGIGLGTAAAVIIPIAGYFLNNAEAAKTFDEAIGDLGVAIDDLQDALDIANAPLSELIEEFGTGAVRVREMNAALAELLMLEALDKLDAATEAVGTGLEDLRSYTDGLTELYAQMAQGGSRAAADIEMQQERIQEAYGISAAQATGIIAAMDRLSAATGAREQAEAARALADTLLAARNEAGQIPPELRATARSALEAAIEAEKIAGPLQASVDSAQDLAATSFGGDWLGTAIARAQTLASTLWNAVSARNAAGGTGTGEGGPGMTMGSGDWMNNSLGFTRPGSELIFQPPPVSSGSTGTGSSGGGSAIEEYTEAQKRALKVIGEVNEASVTQAEVIAALEEMYASGAITSDQLATAIGNVKDEFSDLEKVSFSLSEGLAGVFTDALTGAKSLQDGLKDLLKSMSSLFLNAAFKSFLGGVFPSIDFGGFRAGGGGVTAGRSYIVGERGPELFTPGRSGGITPNSAMRGGGTMVQINNYSGAPVREQRSTGPDGREYVKVIVGEELGSGGYDKQLGRYGATPARVKR